MSQQLYQHSDTQIWCTAIASICELFACYGISYFENDEFGGQGENESSEKSLSDRNTIDLLIHVFDNCQIQSIRLAVAKGFGMVILRGYYTVSMLSKLMIEYFNTTPEAEMNQLLGVLFKTMIERKLQNCLQEALFETIFQISDSSVGKYDFDPEAVITFVITATAPTDRTAITNAHNALASSFLNVMDEKSDDKELVKLLAKYLPKLEIGNSVEIKQKLTEDVNTLLNNGDIRDGATSKYLKAFKETVDAERIQVARGADDGTTQTSSDPNTTASDDLPMDTTVNTSVISDQTSSRGEIPSDFGKTVKTI